MFNQMCHVLRVIIILEFWFDEANLGLLLVFSQMYHGKKNHHYFGTYCLMN